MPNGKEKKERKDLRCAVCNAQAFGFNFDQISCESCKGKINGKTIRKIFFLNVIS
jgi:hypothetical protein